MNEYLCDVPPDAHAPYPSLGDDRVAAQKKEEAMDMDIDMGRTAERQRAARLQATAAAAAAAASDVAGHRDEMDRAASRLPSAASRVQRWRR